MQRSRANERRRTYLPGVESSHRPLSVQLLKLGQRSSLGQGRLGKQKSVGVLFRIRGSMRLSCCRGSEEAAEEERRARRREPAKGGGDGPSLPSRRRERVREKSGRDHPRDSNEGCRGVGEEDFTLQTRWERVGREEEGEVENDDAPPPCPSSNCISP